MLEIVSAIALLTACSTVKPEVAKKAAREWAANVGEVRSVTCTGSDSDGDGYISCTAFFVDPSIKPIRLDCGAERFCVANCARGCKEAEAVKIQGGRTR